MKTYFACLLALALLLTAFWSTTSFAEEEGLKKPKSLWVSDSDSADDEEAKEEEEPKKKNKTKIDGELDSKKSPGRGKPTRKARTGRKGEYGF